MATQCNGAVAETELYNLIRPLRVFARWRRCQRMTAHESGMCPTHRGQATFEEARAAHRESQRVAASHE